MGRSPTIVPAVQDALRAATINEDGLTLTLAGQLDRATYQATAKAIEALGGQWNRKAGTHLFKTDVRPALANLLNGDALPKLPDRNPLDFYPTPEPVVHEMLKRIWPWPHGARFLEPSAGEGAIADQLWGRHSVYADCVELDTERAQTIRKKGYPVVGTDFLAFTPDAPYDYVLMNPPFTAPGDAQAYITHIEHALTCLRPGGDLVAVVPQGYAFGRQKRVVKFREFCEQHAQSPLHTFAPDTFKASGTGVATCLIHLTKPEEAAMNPTTEQPVKRPRKSKKAEAQPERSAAPVDFKEMARLTREKMASGALSAQKAAALTPSSPEQNVPTAEADLPFPVSEAQLEAAVATPLPLTPGTLGLHAVPLSQLTRSECNVRRHYDPAAIEELAASLKAEGQIENATGRWKVSGQIEIVAGESRRRAQVLREEAGETGLTLLVNIRELTDAEALAISATENMRRRNMTPLEECEAMLRLQEAGRTVEDLAALFGYKSLQPVADRILVARNLHTTGRDALDSGELSLAKAFVIARAAGQDLQTAMLRQSSYRSAKDLSAQLTTGQFLVKLAGFNVEKSGLSVRRDMFDTYEPFFEDKARALDAQLAHARALAERRTRKGDWAFVEVEAFKGYWSPYGHKRYDGDASTGGGLVITVNLDTGELKERRNVKLRAAAQAATVPGSTPAPVERELPDSAYLEAHMRRAKAARAAIVGNTHLTLALTVWGLILGNNSDIGRISVGQLSGIGAADLIPAELQTRRDALQQLLTGAPGVSCGSDHVYMAAFNRSGVQADPQKLLALLVAMSDEELLGHLNTLTALVAYNWSAYNNKSAPAAEYVYLAGLTDAPQRLAQDFTLTDDWLKRYPRHELVALAEDAGLGRALVEDAKTLKEMRGRILEHAQRLHTEGFVPRLVPFPDPPSAPDHSERDALRAKAAPIIAGLDRAGIDSVLVSLGLDWTDWDSLDDCRTYLREQVLDMGADELRSWAELWGAAQ